MTIHFENFSNDNRTPLPKYFIKTPTRSRQTNMGVRAKQFMSQWLQDIPKLESHYCRSTTSKLYLEPVFYSKMAGYRQYKLVCHAANKIVFTNFYDEMASQKIAIFKPKRSMRSMY